MRIIGLDDFLAMPAGTVFAKYRPQIFGELCEKGDSIHESRDFLYRPLWEPYAENSGALCDVLTAAEERGAAVEIDTDCWQRDGLYEYGQLFAVFSQEEVRKIASSLVGD
jgi:hypothetical protein